MKKGENNLLVCVGILGRFSQNCKISYKLEENQMIKILGSKVQELYQLNNFQ